MLTPEVLATLNDATLKALLKDETHKEAHPKIQEILAVRKEKPRYQFKVTYNEKGGIKLPFVIYRETAEQFIEALKAQLDNPQWRPYSK